MKTIKFLCLFTTLFTFTFKSKAQQSIEVFSTEGVTITMKVTGIDPANSQTYWTEIDNRSSNDIKISFNYYFWGEKNHISEFEAQDGNNNWTSSYDFKIEEPKIKQFIPSLSLKLFIDID